MAETILNFTKTYLDHSLLFTGILLDLNDTKNGVNSIFTCCSRPKNPGFPKPVTRLALGQQKQVGMKVNLN